MPKLKVFRGNLDGQRDGLAVASSKAKAAKALGLSLHGFNDYFSEATNVDPAGYEPDTLYTRPIGRHGISKEPFTKGRCPL